MNDDDLMPEIEATGARLVKAREMIARRIIGQQAVVEQTLIAILSGGHGLLVGAPGLDDVAALAHPVLIHRMALGFAARAEGQTLAGLIERLVADTMGVE
ncbi:MAG TPA: hypothetical protein VM891_08650, partial [Amaricoccus sp.]|nr:hypothetical protein [Amaricoccus sp.]